MSHVEDVRPREVEVAHIKHHSSSWVDKTLSLAAMLVALSSLGIAVYEARTTHEHRKLTVWPYLSVYSSHENGEFSYIVTNAGIGPALVRSFAVFVDGRPYASWTDAAQAVDTQHRRNLAMYSSIGRGTVLLPGAKTMLLHVPAGPDAMPFAREASKRLNASVCYCSLYEDCWRLDDIKNEAQPVRECRPEGNGGFVR